MEIGAVVGAVRAENVVRETPAPGDKVILLGGRTGRDGIGGATGSSKTHNDASLVTMASEVQKGNAPEERKIQRLFLGILRSQGLLSDATNFGAAVSQSHWWLADGLESICPLSGEYEGLDATRSPSRNRRNAMAASWALKRGFRY